MVGRVMKNWGRLPTVDVIRLWINENPIFVSSEIYNHFLNTKYSFSSRRGATNYLIFNRAKLDIKYKDGKWHKNRHYDKDGTGDAYIP